MRTWCEKLLVKKSIADRKPGDVLALHIPLEPCHCAILGELDLGRGLRVESLIHAVPLAHGVVEHILDKVWFWRIDSCFEFPGALPWQ